MPRRSAAAPGSAGSFPQTPGRECFRISFHCPSFLLTVRAGRLLPADTDVDPPVLVQLELQPRATGTIAVGVDPLAVAAGGALQAQEGDVELAGLGPVPGLSPGCMVLVKQFADISHLGHVLELPVL